MWAPKGQTPFLLRKLTRGHLSVISAITPEGELFLQMQEFPFDSSGVIAFLEELQRQIAGKLLILLDGATIHPSLVSSSTSRTGPPRVFSPGYGSSATTGIWSGCSVMRRS